MEVDELVEVLVSADEIDGEFGPGEPAGGGGEDVVGLEALAGQDGDAHGPDDLDDAVGLRVEIVGHDAAGDLVVGKEGAAVEFLGRAVDRHRQVIRLAVG